MLLSSFYIQHLLSILLMGVALVTKHLELLSKKTVKIRHCIRLSFNNKRFIYCALLARQSAEVIKVGVLYGHGSV